jgi:hypothetical protein
MSDWHLVMEGLRRLKKGGREAEAQEVVFNTTLAKE